MVTEKNGAPFNLSTLRFGNRLAIKCLFGQALTISVLSHLRSEYLFRLLIVSRGKQHGNLWR